MYILRDYYAMDLKILLQINLLILYRWYNHDMLNDYIEKGLSTQEVEEKTSKGQVNEVKDHTAKTTREIIVANTMTLFNAINIMIALFIIITGEYQNLTFMLVVIFNTVIGIFQEIRAKRKLDKLKLLNEPHARVIRDGKIETIESEKIVLGDLLLLSLGNQILADGKVIQGEIAVNESLLTGEANEIIKRPGDMLYAGSFVVSGNAKAEVVSVGDSTYVNHILKKAKKEKRQPSRLRDALDFIIKTTTIIIVPLGLFLFSKQYFLSGLTFDEAIIQTAASMIGMIPEGLILLTSVALSVGAIKLSLNNTLTQSLYSLETLARTDIICFDKTGTITTGDIVVTDMIKYTDFDEDIIANIITVINDQNPTAFALKEYFKVKNKLPIDTVYPFSSKNKYSGGVYDGDTYLVGAYSFLGIENIDTKVRHDIDNYTRSGYRVLAISKNTDLIGLILMQDKIRENAEKTIAYFYEQGTDLKVISGDDPATVSAIAMRLGIKNADRYIDCHEISDEKLKEEVLDHTIFGRVSPDQKLIMVEALKANKKTVAMVGDGVNDVMALKEADCSIAMYNGADSAKNIANIILMDNDFAHMPDIVLEGRRVINNIQRTASLFLIKTVMSILLAVLSIFFLKEYPFAPIQLTLVSSLCIGFPSFILTFIPNYRKITGDFLANILSKAIPSAAAIVLVGIILEIMMSSGLVDRDILNTMYTLIMAAIVIYDLIDISRPLNIITIGLAVIATGGIGLAYFFIPGLFYFVDLDIKNTLIAFILILLGILALKMLDRWHLADKIAGKIDDMY